MACCEIKELVTGDYAWEADTGKRIGIESKTCTDLISSFASGRLSDQLARMVEAYDIPVLLVVGKVARLGDKHVAAESNVDVRVQASHLRPPFMALTRSSIQINVYHSALYNFLLSAQLQGIFIDWISGEMPRYELETARLQELINYFDKPQHSSVNRPKLLNPYSKHPRQQELDVLRALPGISDVIAERLLEKFVNLSNVFAANPGSLSEVEGIGPGKANKIYELVMRGNTIG